MSLVFPAEPLGETEPGVLAALFAERQSVHGRRDRARGRRLVGRVRVAGPATMTGRARPAPVPRRRRAPASCALSVDTDRARHGGGGRARRARGDAARVPGGVPRRHAAMRECGATAWATSSSPRISAPSPTAHAARDDRRREGATPTSRMPVTRTAEGRAVREGARDRLERSAARLVARRRSISKARTSPWRWDPATAQRVETRGSRRLMKAHDLPSHPRGHPARRGDDPRADPRARGVRAPEPRGRSDARAHPRARVRPAALLRDAAVLRRPARRRLRALLLHVLDVPRAPHALPRGPVRDAGRARTRRGQGAAGRARADRRAARMRAHGVGGARLEHVGDRILRATRRARCARTGF